MCIDSLRKEIKNAKTLNTWRHVKVRVARDRNSCVVAIPSPPRPKCPVGLKLQIGWPHLAYFDLRGVRGQRSFGFQTALWEMGARRPNQPRSHNQAYNVIQKGKNVWRWKWADPKWYWRPYPYVYLWAARCWWSASSSLDRSSSPF